MTKLLWNQPGTRFYETGVDRGVLFPKTGAGVSWGGLISVEEPVSGGEAESYYFDGVKYLDWIANEDFQATITAFSAPKEFAVCDGAKALAPGLYATQQRRETFGLSYRTLLGNDLTEDAGYKLHLVYNALAAPTTRSNRTKSDSPDPGTLVWTVNSVPPAATTYKPTAHFVIDSTKTTTAKMTSLENLIYGTASVDSALPTQAAVIALLT